MKHCIYLTVSLLFFVVIGVFSQSDYQKTANELDFQLLKAKKENNMPEVARFQAKLGYLYWENTQNEKALEYFLQAIKTNEDIGNLNAIKTICTNLGMIYSDRNDNEQALIYFRKTLRIDQKTNKRSDVAADLINISTALQALKNGIF